MAWRKITPIIQNTTMEIYTDRHGVDSMYKITPNENYVMHNKARDKIYLDGDGNKCIKPCLVSAPTTCSINYNFTPTEMVLHNGEVVTAYGEKEYYIIAEKIVS